MQVLDIKAFLCSQDLESYVNKLSLSFSLSLCLTTVELARSNISPYAASQSPINQNVRQLSIVELEHATCNFSHSNIIGEGVFGLVYKGLLLDGSIVAVKRCLQKPFLDFLPQVLLNSVKN